ncbi:MAG: hypothetical protein M3209_19465 [Acidobacteriota bacterium]|nr:hypothetical protein [Acidobacteriota bacterium]
MNRHIYGLTLFLIIVKIHLLLYWAFFAPVNFYSVSQPPIVETVAPKAEYPKCRSQRYNTHSLFHPELTNAVIGSKGRISANVRLTRYKALHLENEPDIWFRLHIFDENQTPVWIGEKQMTLNKDKFSQDVLFEMSDGSFARFDRRKNYYAQIETIQTPQRASDNFSYNPRLAREVLFSHSRR